MIYKIGLLPAFFYLSFLILLTFWLGTLVRKKLMADDNQKSTFFVEATLLAFLISFTFSVAAGKYDQRREVFNDEINAISTAIYRIKLYPDSVYADLKPLMNQYFSTG